MHWREAQGDTMEAPHAVPLGRTFQWTSFASAAWPELESTHGSTGVFYSVSEWNADKTRVDKVRYGPQSHACSRNRFVQVGVYGGGWIYGGGGSGHEDSSQTYNVDALQVLF
jgi:hypothetical protein